MNSSEPSIFYYLQGFLVGSNKLLYSLFCLGFMTIKIKHENHFLLNYSFIFHPPSFIRNIANIIKIKHWSGCLEKGSNENKSRVEIFGTNLNERIPENKNVNYINEGFF